jgi:hypothetical protein
MLFAIYLKKLCKEKCMKKMFFLCIFVTAIGFVHAQTNGFVAFGMESNANTRQDAAVGGSISLGLDLSHSLTLGLKTGFSHNIDTVSTLEPCALLRVYFPIKNTLFYAQTELGCSIFFEHGESFAAFMGGLAFGCRFKLSRRFYMEPCLRTGYPFLWGAGLNFGFSFKETPPFTINR